MEWFETGKAVPAGDDPTLIDEEALLFAKYYSF
jgi:hypothetical protein